MPAFNDSENLREDVILDFNPSYLIKFGIVTIAIVFAIVLFSLTIVKYSETITEDVVIHSTSRKGQNYFHTVLNVNQIYLTKLKAGQKVKFNFLSYPDYSYGRVVRQISAFSDADSLHEGFVQIICTFKRTEKTDNGSVIKIRSGLKAKSTIILESRPLIEKFLNATR